jgi:enterochelin esterase-like enzyme
MELAINFNVNIVSGWFPTVVIVVAIVSVVFAIGWWDGAWKMQLLLGIPISLALTGLVAIAIHVWDLVPDAFPNTFYLWAWLLLFSLVVAVMGFMKAHWALRTFSVLAIVFCVIAAFTVVNETYDYYPTLERLFGKEAANFVALPELNAIRKEVRDTGKLPAHGNTIQIQIPATKSHFDASPAYVWVPPIWFKSPEPQLPVIELIAGVPGGPSDWTRAAYADTTSTDFAEQHGGMAPILVMPDDNGPSGDSECANSKLGGNAETYLTEDVPAFMRNEFNAAGGPKSFAIAGLSAGGTCATTLTLRNPTVFQTFAEYSGYAAPTYQNDDEQQTIQDLFEGSTANYEAHSPNSLLAKNQYPTVSGWFEAGEQDPMVQAVAQQLHGLAVHQAHFAQACYYTEPGDHDFMFWEQAFRTSLPWLSWKLNLTPAPNLPSGVDCTPKTP